MNILSAERVRRATEINKDLAIDLQSLEVGLETSGLKELFRAVLSCRNHWRHCSPRISMPKTSDPASGIGWPPRYVSA